MGIAAGGLQRVVRDSNQHFPDLLQVVLLEAAERAEEPIIGLGAGEKENAVEVVGSLNDVTLARGRATVLVVMGVEEL